MFEKIDLFNNINISKIKLDSIPWNAIIADKSLLYSAIADLLLNEENMLYYATNKESSKTLDDTRKYIKRLIESGNLTTNLDDVLKCIGWNNSIDINNLTFQGDLAEYLMNILIDKFIDAKTIISKISLKTSPRMPIFGNDNVYYDFDNDILYFGESKFYNNFKSALRRAETSIDEHNNVEEVSFVRTHTSAFIAENGQKRDKLVEKFENIYSSNINIKSIIFIINDDIYCKKDYEADMISYFNSIEKINEISNEIIFVFLPILSKEEFLKYFIGRL